MGDDMIPQEALRALVEIHINSVVANLKEKEKGGVGVYMLAIEKQSKTNSESLT